MKMVLGLVAGVLRHPEFALVRACETENWLIDGSGEVVGCGAVVAMRDVVAADYFLRAERAVLAEVEPNTVIMFHQNEVADFFVESGLAREMSDDELAQVSEMIRAEREAEMVAAGELPPPETVPLSAEPAPARRGRPRKAA